MKWSIIQKQAQPVTAWSGGETREIYIAPAGSSYASRNFKLRLSSATVTAASTFTDLPGYNRDLVVLAGSLCLQHGKYKPIELKPLDKDHFDGGLRTRSWGTATDFNIMIAKDAEFAASVKVWTKLPEKFAAVPEEVFFYAAAGDFIWQYAGQTKTLPEGALLHICQPEMEFSLKTASIKPALLEVRLQTK